MLLGMVAYSYLHAVAVIGTMLCLAVCIGLWMRNAYYDQPLHDPDRDLRNPVYRDFLKDRE